MCVSLTITSTQISFIKLKGGGVFLSPVGNPYGLQLWRPRLNGVVRIQTHDYFLDVLLQASKLPEDVEPVGYEERSLSQYDVAATQPAGCERSPACDAGLGDGEE